MKSEKKPKKPARKLLYAVLENLQTTCKEANEVSQEIIGNKKHKQVA